MSDWKSSQFSNGVYGALAKLMPGDRLIVDRSQQLAGPVKMTVDMTELLILEALTGGTDVAVELLENFITVRSRGAATITSSFRSAVMVLGRACTVENLNIQNYNTSNTNGHAAIFGYKCQDLTVRNCRTMSGNGNGVRLDGVVGAVVIGNRVYRTGGSSSEGITLGCKHVRCERNIVDRANVTGILVWAGPYEDIAIVGNTVSNSSQTAASSHPGIGISLQSSQITGLRVEDNCCYDDQVDDTGKPAPTQSHALAIYGPGTINQSVITGNIGYGNQNGDPLTLVDAPAIS